MTKEKPFNAHRCTPTHVADVLLYSKRNHWFIGFYQHGQWWVKSALPLPVQDQGEVTHWLELPEWPDAER